MVMIDFPVTAEYVLKIKYAADEARPVDVLLDGKRVGKGCTGVTLGSAPFVKPIKFSANGKEAKWERVSQGGKPIKLSITQGKHTLKFTRRGPLPNLVALRLHTRRMGQPRRALWGPEDLLFPADSASASP